MKLMELLVPVTLDTKNFEQGISRVSKAGDSFSESMNSFSAKTIAVGNALYDLSKQAVSSAVSFTKTIVNEYAEAEQLMGGVETIFKDSAQAVISNAQQAYMTAGMSANEYMQTVTGFSSSLLQGLEGDTARAAQVADMAVRDMSDNANKFGTDIASIQNAYQGFAKDNFTMLDNLKLGYGGTASEMARLINDSGVLSDTIVDSSNVAQVPLDKMYEAIHAIQTELDITGTTAKEASQTISGSVNSFKASWKNTLAGLGTEKDMGPLVKNLVNTGTTMLKNFANLLPDIGRNVLDAVDEMLYEFDFYKTLREAYKVGDWDAVFDAGVEMAKEGFKKLENNFGNLWDTTLPTLAQNGANTVIRAINTVFGTNIPELDEISFPTWEEVKQTVSDWWTGIKSGIETVATWTLGIFTAPEETAEEMKAVIGGWWTDTAKPAIEDACQWVLNLFDVPSESGETIAAKIGSWWETAGQYVTNACTWTLSMFGVPTETAADIKKLVSTWWNGIDDVVAGVCKIAFSLVSGDTEAAKQYVLDWWDDVKSLSGDMLTIGFDIVEPFVSDVQEALKEWWNDVRRGLGFVVEVGAGVHTSSSGATHGSAGVEFGERLSDPTVWESETGAYGPAYIPSHRTGLDRVPYDDYLALLHEDEAVLTREEANEWRSGGMNTENIESLLLRILSALSNMRIDLDGRSVGNLIAPYVSENIAT